MKNNNSYYQKDLIWAKNIKTISHNIIFLKYLLLTSKNSRQTIINKLLQRLHIQDQDRRSQNQNLSKANKKLIM